MLKGKNFADGYFGSHSIIGSRALSMINGADDPSLCHAICNLVDQCTHWTVDLDDEEN